MMNAGEQVALIDEGQTDRFEAVNAALPVFESTLTVFLNQLDAIDQKVTKKLRQSILAQVSLRLSSQIERQHLNAWITGSADRLEINIGVGDMQNCIHHAYHSACEYFGPTKTDEFLSKAVKHTETLPIAMGFSPHKLF
ncbi:MAG: hypothetical protein OEU74_09300 [Gammaproteobacteria bacterium]|nr:hypothetical protein [Gammaproteobacteria bacterium]